MPTLNSTTLQGTAVSEELTGTGESDVIVGLAGNDSITGDDGADALYGDYGTDNLLEGTDGATGFQDYADTGNWSVTEIGDGHQAMSQSISTELGGVYNLSFDLAANFAAGNTDAAVEILVNGVVIGTYASESGAFSSFDVSFTADTETSEITIRSISGAPSGPVIDTSGPIFHYAREMDIGGQTVEVAAFADGQSNFYQVLNGTLHVFDVETETYQVAGETGTVNVNSMGFNSEDGLLYAIAVGTGTDALGQAVERSDLVIIDAEGNSYRVGETPYRSWTGDFDDQGNLWSFQSSMDRISVIDVDQFDADGNPVVTVHSVPANLVQGRFYDVAFDAATQSFYGVARPSAEGENTEMLVIDISSGSPVFSTVAVTSTVIDGVVHDGAPAVTFGAAIVDANGNLFVGGNNGDHDMNDATGNSGGIYRVVIDPATGEASLHLVTAAPGSYSNDGSADPNAFSPFADIDITSSVLISEIELLATTEGELTYDDDLVGGAGHDTLAGGIGEDELIGGSAGDTLEGGTGNDVLHGGNGPNSTSTGHSYYDDEGLRYDEFGNLLQEDDDSLSGGAGEDSLYGSAGHDTLDGGDANDYLNGGSGWDVLIGGAGDDVLAGGGQADTLVGGEGSDNLGGGTGDDSLDGNDGNDVLEGGSDNDILHGSAGDDTLDGGSGNDVLDGGLDADSLIGGSGDDALSGGDGEDALTGGSGNDSLDGGSGNDSLRGGVDDDLLEGGAGNDRLQGDSGHDAILGGSGRDYLSGASGDDTLDGGDGRDTLSLGAGNDIATGGADADRFVFRSHDLDGSTDVITDFDVSEGDYLDLRSLNVASSVVEFASWFSDSVTANGNDVHIALASGTTLVLLDQNADLGAIYDSFLF